MVPPIFNASFIFLFYHGLYNIYRWLNTQFFNNDQVQFTYQFLTASFFLQFIFFILLSKFCFWRIYLKIILFFLHEIWRDYFILFHSISYLKYLMLKLILYKSYPIEKHFVVTSLKLSYFFKNFKIRIFVFHFLSRDFIFY
jgi:hypothetical protein